MKTSDFNFELPRELIAQYPPAERGQSRLMVMNRKGSTLEHRMVKDLPSIIESGTLMVFNNSRVRKARLFGVSEATGKKVEFLLLKKHDEITWYAIAKKLKHHRTGTRCIFDDIGSEIVTNPNVQASASLYHSENNNNEILTLRFDKPIDDTWLDEHGHIPLPPYIKREDREEDAERYQTIYAGEYGSVAAPTAGLHFTEELFSSLKSAGIETVFITLHVGLGTFLPVRAENIEDHNMHEETYFLDESIATRIEKAKNEGRKILAVGTTSVRTLESAYKPEGYFQRGEGSTSIFIYPGYKFKVVDEIFTNFHTPESTLLMLVSAFAGKEFILDSYREAVKEGYRFFSYGDACLIK